MAPKKDTTPSKKKDKYRIRNWKEYSAPQAHGQGKKIGRVKAA